MKSRQIIRVFTDRYPFVGPAFWVLSIQYYLIQIITALSWSMPYSIRDNTISDLGNTVCGLYAGRVICSPLHSLMNASFIMLGITMIVGSALIYQEFRERLVTAIGFTLMALAGFGTVLVGLFPENTISALHTLGAGLPFVLGNIALVLFSLVLPLGKALRVYTLLSGIIALVALGLFFTNHYGGLGPGGMERLAAYPQSIWLIAFGLYLSRNHSRVQARQ